MPSPIAHTFAGLMIAGRSGIWTRRLGSRWILLAAIAANAPDLDFLFGLAVGSINAYHPNPSHSILGALVFALAVALVWDRTWAGRCRLAWLMVLLYGSHILLDMFSEPSLRRPGLQLFWPLSDQGFLSPWRPLSGIRHGGSRGGVGWFLEELFSWHNLRAVTVEVVVFLPLLWLSLITSYGGRSRATPQGAHHRLSDADERPASH